MLARAAPATFAAQMTDSTPQHPANPRPTIGWREWVAFPSLEIPRIKAKVDTGARTSALHAFKLSRYSEDGVAMVEFEVHPLQRSDAESVTVTAEVLEDRAVRSSSGELEVRPVVLLDLNLGGLQWTAEVTLTNRDAMGFRMLLGRSAIRSRFLVDPSRSYLADRNMQRKAARRKAKP